MSYRIQNEDGSWGKWSGICVEVGDVVTVIGPYARVQALVIRPCEMEQISRLKPEDIYIRGIVHKGIRR